MRTATSADRLSRGGRRKYTKYFSRLVAQEQSDFEYARDFLLSVKAAMCATVSFLSTLFPEVVEVSD